MGSLLMITPVPVDFSEIYRMERKIRNALHPTGDKSLDLEGVHEARSYLEILLAVFTSKLLECQMIKTKAHKLMYHYFKMDLGRMQKILDDKQDEYIDRVAAFRYDHILSYARIIRLYLDVLIVEPITHAASIAGGDKERFLYELFVTFTKNVSIFGSESRTDKVKKEISSSIVPQTYEEFNSEDIQKDLEKDYDDLISRVEKIKRKVEKEY